MSDAIRPERGREAQELTQRSAADYLLAGAILVSLAVLVALDTVKPTRFLVGVMLAASCLACASGALALRLRDASPATKLLATVAVSLAAVAGLTTLIVLAALLPCRSCG